MPRPPLRAAAPTIQDPLATPTRPQTNAITAAIPPFMLETPPHAPFLTTPHPPSNNPGNSIVPTDNVTRAETRRTQQTPINEASDQINDPSQLSSGALSSIVTDPINANEQALLESAHHSNEDAKTLQGLRDISSLATWTLSSAKPGCALAQLRYPSPLQFWQSDGPQPHTLTLHFFKLVAIVKMRIYLDFQMDESYTPTKMRFFAGMSEGALVEFGSWEAQEGADPETGEPRNTLESLQGWLEIPLQGVGGKDTTLREADRPNRTDRMESDMEADGIEEYVDDVMGGDVLKAMVVQIQICENHQNGKDTHVRGFQVFARDDASSKELRKVIKKNKMEQNSIDFHDEEIVGLQPADWMGDPEVR